MHRVACVLNEAMGGRTHNVAECELYYRKRDVALSAAVAITICILQEPVLTVMAIDGHPQTRRWQRRLSIDFSPNPLITVM